MDLSIVIPIYNEAGSLESVVSSVIQVCKDLSSEVILVNDGSTDLSLKIMKDLSDKHSQVKIVSLKRNFGQTAALSAGIDSSCGQIIITLDADGQNDPNDIPLLVSKLKEGYDVVSGWRKERKDSWIMRTFPSKLANLLISYSTGLKLHDYGCTLKAYRRSAIENIQMYGEMHRFLPAWCAWYGSQITELPVKHHPRLNGTSNYGMGRAFKVVIDLLTLKFFSGYLNKPNYLFSGGALFFLLLSGISVSVALIDKYGADQFPKYRLPLLLLSAFLALVSIFLILMGLLAELLVRLYFQVRNQKAYVLSEKPEKK